MATELVTESTANKLTAPFETPLSDLIGRSRELMPKPLTLTTLQLMKELDSDCQGFLKTVDNSELSTQVKAAFSLHRFLTAAKKKFTDPPTAIRAAISSKFAQWELKRRQEEADERRKREREAQAEQERIRLEDAAHLEQLGHKEEANALLDAPLPPVSLPESEPVGKLDGVIVSTVWEWDGLTDPKAFFHFIADNPAYQGLMLPVMGAWKKLLTSNRGSLVVPGLRIRESTETRHRNG